MADLLIGSGSGSGVSGSSGTGMPASTTRRPSAAPAPSSSPSGIRGPRVIMQERAAREAARQRAEAEQQAMERSRAAEQEARLMDDSRRRAERRAAAAAAIGLGPGPEQGGATDMPPHFHDPRLGQAYAAISQAQGAAGLAAHAPQAQLRPDITSHIPAGQGSPTTYAPKHQRQPSHGGAEPRAGESATHGTDAPKPKNAFPHAFERWEILSAHWEGLTSYWIRKLEQNKEEISRDPMSQQLARQVTDLSAAGANLFHAVVELQRLRASSERKFQRWFFETRAELERSHEVNAMLEAALERERRGRDQAIQEAVDHERGISKTQKQIIEMRKELSISKDEARRAWEELGRREQEERDRTYSLQTGQPTIVGGVQVVPMTQSTPSRHASTRDAASYQSDYSTRPTYSIDQQAAAAAHAQAQAQAHAQAQAQASPAGGSGIGLGGGSTSSTPHQSHGGGAQDHPSGRLRAGGSESGYSEGEYLIDAQGDFILDPHGKRIAVALPPSSYAGSDAEVDDYDTPATTNPPSGGFDAAAGVAGPQHPPQPQAHPQHPQDYTGQGYGGTGWEAVPRHHHPTRLSDVIEEEDERSRTSGGRSRG